MTTGTLADFLVPVAPALDAALIDAPALAAIHHVAAGLPAGLGLCLFGFECDLADPRPGADFLVSCTRRCEGPALLAAVAAAHGYDAVARFAAGWTARLDDVWLEFDLRHGDSSTPSLFFAPAAWCGPACVADVERGLRALDDGRPPAALAAVVEAIPRHAGLFQVGRMLARAEAPVRLCIGPMLPDVAGGFLAAIAHPAAPRAVEVMARLASSVDAVAIGLDLDDGAPGTRLGIECYRRSMLLARHGAGETRLLDALRAEGACTAAKAAALARYPGYASVLESPGIWPPSLDGPVRFLTDGSESFLVRRLHHVKVVLDATSPARAKAYLGVQPHWRKATARSASTRKARTASAQLGTS
jgi:hypothetical protein